MTELLNNDIESPYKIIPLKIPISIYPYQLDNKIYIHIKNNLTSRYVGKCYENFGYISKIYKINECSEGRIEPENSSLINYDTSTLCKLCCPLKNKLLICKINKLNNELIGANFGPINIIIQNQNINKNNFIIDTNRRIRTINGKNVIESNMYIKILILTSIFNKNDNKIIVFGYLVDMATENEIKWFNDEHNENKTNEYNDEELNM